MTRQLAPILSAYVARALALAAAVVLLPTTALGQEASPAPSDSSIAAEVTPAPSSEPASGVGDAAEALVASLPASLAGVPIDPANVVVLSGHQITQGSEVLEEQYRLVEEATGVAIEEMSLLNAYVQTPDDDLFYVGAIKVPGADASLVRDVVATLAVETGNGTIEEAEVAGLPVTVFVEDRLAEPTTYIHPLEDVLWLVLGPEEVAVEVLTHVSG